MLSVSLVVSDPSLSVSFREGAGEVVSQPRRFASGYSATVSETLNMLRPGGVRSPFPQPFDRENLSIQTFAFAVLAQKTGLEAV